MSKSISSLRRVRLWFMKRCPGLYVRLSQCYNSFRWRDEKRGWAGEHRPGGQPSVMFFSYYRCGSMFLSRALRELAVANGLQPLDYCSYFVKACPDESDKLFEEESLGRAFHPEGCYYGTLRRAYPIPNHERFRSVLLLRDPRDCLVSHYFSIRESHTLNNHGNLEARSEALSMDVDSWVLAHMEDYRRDFLEFHEKLAGKPGVLFLRYEEMVSAFPEFIRQVVEHTGLTGVQAVADRIVGEASFEVSSENVLSHKRSVQPGNHLKKLKPETVAQMNDALADVLKAFHYEVPSNLAD
ncbi:MAG: sulfotransferase domain-containing protein [Roseibacillus sp.]